MADLTANEQTIADHAHESAEVAAAYSPGVSITGALLFVMSFVIGALFVAETIFGLLWALSGEFRTYVAFLR